MRLSSVHALGVTFIYVVRTYLFWGSSNQRHLGDIGWTNWWPKTPECIDPRSLTWNLKINPWKRRFRSWKPSLLSGFMLNFGGCKLPLHQKMPDTCTSKPVLVFHTHHLKMAALSHYMRFWDHPNFINGDPWQALFNQKGAWRIMLISFGGKIGEFGSS